MQTANNKTVILVIHYFNDLILLVIILPYTDTATVYDESCRDVNLIEQKTNN
mgnify:FL=1